MTRQKDDQPRPRSRTRPRTSFTLARAPWRSRHTSHISPPSATQRTSKAKHPLFGRTSSKYLSMVSKASNRSRIALSCSNNSFDVSRTSRHCGASGHLIPGISQLHHHVVVLAHLRQEDQDEDYDDNGNNVMNYQPHVHHYYIPSHTHRWTWALSLSPSPPKSAAWALHFPTCRSFFNNLQNRWLGPLIQPLCSWLDGSHCKCLRALEQKTTHVFCKVKTGLILFLSFFNCLCYHSTNDNSWTLFHRLMRWFW